MNLPLTYDADYLVAKKPFVHVDRIANFQVMIYLKYGKMFVIEDGIEYVLTPGTVFFLKRGVHHWGEKPCEPNTAWYYVHFNAERGQDEVLINKEDVHLGMNTCKMQEQDYKKYYKLPKILHLPDENKIEEALRKYIAYLHTPDNVRILRANIMLAEILASCYEQSLSVPNYIRKNRHITKILQYLEEHYSEPFSMEAIGKATGLNYKYASELFKKETGQLIRDYYMHLRMCKAEHLLYETDLSIAEISEQVGFTDSFYFSKVFRKFKGVAPSVFRKRNMPPI